MEFFIEKVKQHPCLWNMSDKSYRDIVKKDLAWERIAGECEIANGKYAKSQWKKLRDSHREALRRRKTYTGQAAQNSKPWRYEIIMNFLLPQIQHNETISNFSPIQNNSESISNLSTSDTITDAIPSLSPPPESTRSTGSTSLTVQSGKKSSKQVDLTTLLQCRENNREQRRIERDQLRRDLIDSNRTQDALSDLFTSLCKKTRELPKYLQLRVQREIFETITRAEEEALSYGSINTYYCSTPSTSSSYNYPTTNLPVDSPLPDISLLPGVSPLPDVSPVPEANPSSQPHDPSYLNL